MFSDPIAFSLIFIGFIFFLGFLFSQVSNDYIDVLDALSVSFVMLVPLLFLLFEGLILRVSGLIGVKFPFVLMFGLLFLISFLIIFRLFVRINKLKNELVKLTQFVALEANEKTKMDVE